MESTCICILSPFQMGWCLGGTSKGGQEETLEYLCPCSADGVTVWQKFSGHRFCLMGSFPRLQRSHQIPATHQVLPGLKVGRVDVFPLMLVPKYFPTF